MPYRAAMATKKETPRQGTRDKLIDAAFRAVARDGLADTNVKSIAAEAGVNPGLLHYHFASKDALLEAAVESATARYMAEIDALIEATPRDRLFDTYVEFAAATLDANRDLTLPRKDQAQAFRTYSSSKLANISRRWRRGRPMPRHRRLLVGA